MFLHQVHQQGFGRPVKHAVDELLDHRADYLPLGLRWPVHMRPVLLRLLEKAFLLQDLHHGHHGGVGHLPPLQQRFIHVPHRDAFALPDHLHDFQLLLGERPASSSHTNELVLISLNVKPKMGRTTPFACRDGVGRGWAYLAGWYFSSLLSTSSRSGHCSPPILRPLINSVGVPRIPSAWPSAMLRFTSGSVAFVSMQLPSLAPSSPLCPAHSRIFDLRLSGSISCW